MSIGCSIYFTPVDPSWIGTPEFIRGMASWLELDTFDSVRVFRDAPASSGLEPDPQPGAEKLLELRAVPVETAISSQRTDAHHSTVLAFGTTPAIVAMAGDVTSTLPVTLTEGFAPIKGGIYNGPWKHYDYNSGDQVTESACCFILSNDLGYPVELDAYLEAFLTVPSVVRLQQRLQELSGRSWHVLIDLE